jgi:GT2 family glycosyltransferase
MPVIPVIIPFYKEHEKLRKCQAAIAAQTQPGCEAFVRDNTHDNILYTAAVNEGLAKYCYREDVRYVIVLNQDAYMHKDCVRHLVEFMDAHPECGIACPIQYAQTKPPSRWGGLGSALSFEETRVVTWGGSMRAFPFGVHGVDAIGSYKEPFETHWANGACMMIRAQTVRECGLFDRNMRFVCSDSDFSFTARARGWKVFGVPKALCEHSLGASHETSNLDLQLVKARDGIYFAEKWLSGGVYRRLAWEGPDLPAGEVRQWLARLRYQARKVERSLGRSPSDQALYFLVIQQQMEERPEGPSFQP